MYYKMMKKGNLVNQFELILNLASFDCFYSLDVSLIRIYALLGINPEGM